MTARVRVALPLAAALLILGLVWMAGTADARLQTGTADLGRDGGWEEFDFRMDAGATIAFNWTTGEVPVYFDLHTHDGADVEYLRQEPSATALNGTYTASERATLSFYWQNDGDRAADLAWRIDGAWIGYEEHFPDELEGTPGPGALAALGALGATAATVRWARGRRSRGERR